MKTTKIPTVAKNSLVLTQMQLRAHSREMDVLKKHALPDCVCLLRGKYPAAIRHRQDHFMDLGHLYGLGHGSKLQMSRWQTSTDPPTTKESNFFRKLPRFARKWCIFKLSKEGTLRKNMQRNASRQKTRIWIKMSFIVFFSPESSIKRGL